MEDSADHYHAVAPEQSAAPFFEALAAYVEEDVLGFHMPGHGQGRVLPRSFRDFLSRHGLAADITQVLGMDDILRPENATLRAQQLAAELYGADATYFLVNGSSCGIHAMLLATLGPGEAVLVPRNAHRSTLAGLELSGARPIFYAVPFQPEMGAYQCAEPETLRRALATHPEVRAVFLTTPTYYGAGADVEALVRLAHEHGKPVLVDEAWGPHLTFHSSLPRSALQAGADLVVHSTHKLLFGMSQAAMLHLRGDRVDRDRLRHVLNALQTTSPNTLLVASLDVSRRHMAMEGNAYWQTVLHICSELRSRINELPGFHCFGPELDGQPGCQRLDLSRLVVSVPGTGYAWERYLRRQHKIQVEMADLFNVVLLVHAAHSPGDRTRLIQALASGPQEARPSPALVPQRIPTAPLTMRDALHAPQHSVPLSQAAGRVCAESICPYPPGIPVLLPGERIEAELLDYLVLQQQLGAKLQGAADPELKTVRVVK